MQPADFHPDRFEQGRKYALDLELGPPAGVSMPVLLIRGATPGKRLVATAAVHGDEFEGVRALLETYQALDPSAMTGDLLAVPVANPPAFWNGTRTSPLDGGNLARVFPGTLESGPTPAIAHHLARAIISHADFFLDLHSAGVKWLMPSMVGYDAHDDRSRAAAFIFGASVLWGHPTLAPGRTVSFAATRGIPWLYTEARGAARIDAEDLRMFSNGILNLLRHLGILPGKPERAPIRSHLYGGGNLDEGLLATRRGFFIPKVELLQAVVPGQELGSTFDLHGNEVETFRSPSAGVIGMVRQFPVVEPGEPLFAITELRE
jgi:predicted deacylase